MESASPRVQQFVDEYIAEVSGHLRGIPGDAVSRASERLLRAYREGAQVLVAGNGGSASTASHLACDLGKTVLGANPTSRSSRFRVISLVDNIALVTAWANDEGYDTVFAEQVKALGKPGDVLVVLTVSGNSPNVLSALRAARERGLETIGLLGRDGGEAQALVDESIVVECDDYGHVESAHLVLGHLLSAWFKLHIADEA
ncbi:MAG: SIS domain-containing protein [Actinobacteria bacterium]|nr:SIS domain-containing protein [Actinomycetota bacterium]